MKVDYIRITTTDPCPLMLIEVVMKNDLMMAREDLFGKLKPMGQRRL